MCIAEIISFGFWWWIHTQTLCVPAVSGATHHGGFNWENLLLPIFKCGLFSFSFLNATCSSLALANNSRYCTWIFRWFESSFNSIRFRSCRAGWFASTLMCVFYQGIAGYSHHIGKIRLPCSSENEISLKLGGQCLVAEVVRLRQSLSVLSRHEPVW